MIRILHVIGAMDRGGAETMIMNIYRKIDKSMFQFDFLVHEDRECDYDEEIYKLGGKIYSVPRYKIFNYYEYNQRIKDFFVNHHDYDIVHGHICSSINIYLKEAKKYNIKCIAHSHSSNFGFSLNTAYMKSVSKRTVKISDYYFGCSIQAGVDRYSKKIVNSNNFYLINNGIDSQLYIFNQRKRDELRNKYKLKDKIVFGHVGRFTQAKNHDFMIDLFDNIKKANNNSVLVFVGRGELEDKIKEKVKEKKLEDSVIFLGVVDDIYNILNLFDVFLFPSLFEGLGIALIEAQANGLPCLISSTIPKEAVLDSRCKVLSLDESIQTWTKTALDLANNKERPNNYKLTCEKGFDINETTRYIEKLYSDFVNK